VESKFEKLPHYYFSWIVSSRNRDKCEMLPLQTKQSRGKLLPHSDLMNMKTKELGWKENHAIQNIVIEDSEQNILIDQR
jgi:hypothetical protein